MTAVADNVIPLARDLSLQRDRPADDRRITRHHNAPEVTDFTSEENAALENARESLGALKKTFAHWITIGRAVQICRARAEAIGGKETFHRLLERSGFGGLADRKGKNSLSLLEQIMAREADVVAWHGTLTGAQQLHWASPQTVIKHCPFFTKPRSGDKPFSTSSRLTRQKREIAGLRAHIEDLEAAYGPLPRSTIPVDALAGEEQTAKWLAKRAEAEAVIRLFGAPISNDLRAEYVAALETLPPEHPAQLVRTRIGMSFDQLTVAAADKSKQDKVA